MNKAKRVGWWCIEFADVTCALSIMVVAFLACWVRDAWMVGRHVYNEYVRAVADGVKSDSD